MKMLKRRKTYSKKCSLTRKETIIFQETTFKRLSKATKNSSLKETNKKLTLEQRFQKRLNSNSNFKKDFDS